MKFKIIEIQTVKGTGRLYVDVAFLDGGQIVHRNDFVMELRPTHRRYIGRVGENGEQLDKGEEYFEEYDTDVAATIVANIQRDAARAAMKRADNRDPGIVIEDTDPLGLRAKEGVADLIGAEVAV
jgi:hypothetical protein